MILPNHMKYRLYTKTEKAWDAMLEAIVNARTSIYWECYILLDDTPAHRFFEILAQKAREGVSVKIVIDSYGVFWDTTSGVEKKLREAGAEVLYFHSLVPWWNPVRFRNWWFMRNHRKVLIVDERIGFVGGVNVGEEFRKWFDLHMRVEGTMVKQLLRSFALSYRSSGGKSRVLHALTKKQLPLIARAKAYYVAYAPTRRRSHLRTYYINKFKMAKERITIVTPYFMPHRWFLDALSQARARGVRVEVILPQQSENRLVTRLNHFFACQAAHRGITVLLFEKMNHAKAVLVDGVEGMIGSSNIDANSFHNNWEANVVFQRRDMVRALERTIARWRQSAHDFRCMPHHGGFVNRLMKGFVGALHSFM